MKAFTKKQYEETLNAIYHNDYGTKYRREFPKDFNREYESAVIDSDCVYMVTGKYLDD